jgi:hypothetical protein
VATLGLLVLLSGTAGAQNSPGSIGPDYRQGRLQIYTGYGGSYYSIDDRDFDVLDDESENLYSYVTGVGVRVYRGMSLYAQGVISAHFVEVGSSEDVFWRGEGTLGFRVTPWQGARYHTQPYAKLGIGTMWLKSYRSAGFACWQAALGIDHYVGRRVALYGEINASTANLNRTNDGDPLADNLRLTTLSVHVGLTFRVW